MYGNFSHYQIAQPQNIRPTQEAGQYVSAIEMYSLFIFIILYFYIIIVIKLNNKMPCYIYLNANILNFHDISGVA